MIARTLSLCLALAICTSAIAVADVGPALVAAADATAPNFGTPPSGQIPILYNDHTVYAKPDTLKQGRVLAALVKDGQIYVPLQSMFEAMGATVSVSTDGNMYTVTRGDTSASVTMGKNEIVVDGAARPLDVPPIMYEGVVLVPVRVLSEALGAYVEWVPARQLVVVRYIPPTPPPTAPPTMAPTPPPPPPPTPSPVPIVPSYTFFVQGATTWSSHNYNEFVAGPFCESFQLNAAYAPLNSKFAVKVDYRSDSYITSDNLTDLLGNEFTYFSTIDGGTAFTPVFWAHQVSLDGRLEYQIAAPRIYVGLGYIWTSNNYGYPHWDGLGVGVEKLPDLRPGIGVYGSAFYYPTVTGNYTETIPLSSNVGKTYQMQYSIWQLDIGLTLALRHSPLYLYGGYGGYQFDAKKNAPIGQSHDGPYLGVGIKF
jgi:hypothetical protein